MRFQNVPTFPAAATPRQHNLDLGLPRQSASFHPPTIEVEESMCSFTCNLLGCEDITFSSKSALKLHMNKHERPYRCTISSCKFPNGFATKADLERHKRAKHKDPEPAGTKAQSGSLSFYCPQPDCIRSAFLSTNKPFVRKDHLQEHMKRIHYGTPLSCLQTAEKRQASATIDAPSSFPESEGRESTGDQVSTFGPSPEKRRRLEDNTLSPANSGTADCEVKQLQKRIERLEKENAKLSEELDASRKNEATLIGVVCRLTNR